MHQRDTTDEPAKKSDESASNLDFPFRIVREVPDLCAKKSDLGCGFSWIMQIKQIVKLSGADIITDEDKCLRFKNGAGAIYLVIPSSDPDISVFLEEPSEEKLLCIEIKGGQDVANVHNRAGEAEKAHLKASQAGWLEKWTVIYLVGLQYKQADKLLTESPSTDAWFDINEVCAQSGRTYESFKHALAVKFDIVVG